MTAYIDDIIITGTPKEINRLIEMRGKPKDRPVSPYTQPFTGDPLPRPFTTYCGDVVNGEGSLIYSNTTSDPHFKDANV